MDMLHEPFLQWTLLSTKGRYKYKTLSSYIYYACTRHLNHYIYMHLSLLIINQKNIWLSFGVWWVYLDLCAASTQKSRYNHQRAITVCSAVPTLFVSIAAQERTGTNSYVPSYWLVGSSGNGYTHTKSHATAAAAGNSFTSSSIRAEWLV